VGVDRRTYERDVVLDWVDVHKSSPISGLPMFSCKGRNWELWQTIKKWVTDDEIPLNVSIPMKRKAEDDMVSEFWDLHLSHGEDTWSIRVPPTAPVSDVVDRVFRFLNYKAPTHLNSIKLFAGSTLVPSNNQRLISTVIKSGDTLRIEAQSQRTLPTGHPLDYSSISGRCLVKVYSSSHNYPQLCFWLPKDTDCRVLTVLIRCWLWSEEDISAVETRASTLTALVPAIYKNGDDLHRYWRLGNSERLEDVIRKFSMPGWFERDPLHEDQKSTERKSSWTKF
jgi:hypothetical protein